MYGARIRKRTTLLSNSGATSGLRLQCDGSHIDLVLAGTWWGTARHRRLPQTFSGAAYPVGSAELCREMYRFSGAGGPAGLSRSATSVSVGGRRCGASPGPAGGHSGMLLEDVTETIARMYDRLLEDFVVIRGGCSLVRLVEKCGVVPSYLRTGYAQRLLGHGAAGQSISGVHRLLSLAMSLGAAPSPEDQHLRPLWRILKNREKKVPVEIRRPVHRQAAVVLSVTFGVKLRRAKTRRAAGHRTLPAHA